MNMHPHSAHVPAVDRDVIRTFCETVFDYLEGMVPVRLLAEPGTASQKPRQAFPAVADVADTLIREAMVAANIGRGVFVVPGTVARAGSAKAQDIVETGVLLIDLDQGDIQGARDHLACHLGDPSLEVASGGITAEGEAKLHLYWRLTEAARGKHLALVARLRAEIAEKVGGDRSFASLHQPIRVPGTIHGKHGVQNPVRLLAHRDLEYDLADLAELIAAMPVLSGLRDGQIDVAKARETTTAHNLWAQTVRAEGLDGITRFEALSRMIGQGVRDARLGRSSIENARKKVLDYNFTMLKPSFDEGKVRREFDAILAKDTASYARAPEPASPLAERSSDQPAAPELSDDAIAAAFVDAHGAAWRYVPAGGSWLHWDGSRWCRDDRNKVRDLVRKTCRAMASVAESPQMARRIASQKTVDAVFRLAMSDPAITASADNWDAEPLLLNTPAGIVDLATGELGPHDPARMLSQVTIARPGEVCTRWLRFLDDITGGDTDLQGYLQRLAGYCLSGSTKEQVFAFLHGQGANGKSVFLQVIASVMGSYAMTAASGTFMKRRGERHLTELAGLKGARLVIVAETEGGGAWDEERIKQVTGGETLRANFMHRDHFEFRPEFKLIIAGNHRPALTSTGEAMRRRLHLVPFAVTIPADERDPDLLSKLLEERDGILGWMLAGCIGWQRIGLRPSAAMIEATKDYFAGEDVISQWLEECCQVGRTQRATSRALYESWKAWAEASGNDTGTQKGLGEALRAHGFQAGAVERSRGWIGLAPIAGQDGTGGVA